MALHNLELVVVACPDQRLFLHLGRGQAEIYIEDWRAEQNQQGADIDWTSQDDCASQGLEAPDGGYFVSPGYFYAVREVDGVATSLHWDGQDLHVINTAQA